MKKKSLCNLHIPLDAFIDSTIDVVASAGPDSWLGNLHCILFMDDTAVLASSREKVLQKVILLKMH